MRTRTDTQIEGKIINSDEFHRKATQWASRVRALAKRNTAAFTKGKNKPYIYGSKDKNKKGEKYTKWHKHGEIEPLLSKSISYKIKEISGITDSIKIQFPRHGVFRAYGVGNGQPISGGIAKKIKRSMSDWADNPIDQNIEKLADIASEFYGDQVCINAHNTLKINKL